MAGRTGNYTRNALPIHSPPRRRELNKPWALRYHKEPTCSPFHSSIQQSLFVGIQNNRVDGKSPCRNASRTIKVCRTLAHKKGMDLDLPGDVSIGSRELPCHSDIAALQRSSTVGMAPDGMACHNVGAKQHERISRLTYNEQECWHERERTQGSPQLCGVANLPPLGSRVLPQKHLGKVSVRDAVSTHRNTYIYTAGTSCLIVRQLGHLHSPSRSSFLAAYASRVSFTPVQAMYGLQVRRLCDAIVTHSWLPTTVCTSNGMSPSSRCQPLVTERTTISVVRDE